jgi:hypothetical protein
MNQPFSVLGPWQPRSCDSGPPGLALVTARGPGPKSSGPHRSSSPPLPISTRARTYALGGCVTGHRNGLIGTGARRLGGWVRKARVRGRRSRLSRRSLIGISRHQSGSRAPGRSRARAGGAVRRSETSTIVPIASCLQGTILAPTPARPPRPAAWLTAIGHFG